MNEIEEYEKLVELAQEQRDEKARLKGSLDNIVQNLKDLGYISIKHARLDLSEKKKQKSEKEKERASRLFKFKAKYGKYLQKTN